MVVLMKAKAGKTAARRRPKQRRAHQTVEAVLDAVARVLKREGVNAVTTNRIAEVAGVSIGSVYQYFPDKRSLSPYINVTSNRSIASSRPSSSNTPRHHLKISSAP
jgi:hypothetical protein